MVWFVKRQNYLLYRIGLFILITVSMASVGWRLLGTSGLGLSKFSWPFALAVCLATVLRVINAYGWGLVLYSMYLPVPGLAATKLWLRAESRRWLPGGVWGYTSRATMASDLGIGMTAALASMMLELTLVILAALLVILPGFIIYRDELFGYIADVELGSTFLIIGCVTLASVLLGWPLRRTLAKKLANLQIRIHALQGIRFNWKSGCEVAIFYVGMNILNGLITVVLCKFVPSASEVPALAVLAASSSAWLVGFFAFFSPGGLLVREAAFAALLIPWMPYADALAIAVVARVAQLTAEGLTVGILALEQLPLHRRG